MRFTHFQAAFNIAQNNRTIANDSILKIPIFKKASIMPRFINC